MSGLDPATLSDSDRHFAFIAGNANHRSMQAPGSAILPGIVFLPTDPS
jgi:hypothetical protein